MSAYWQLSPKYLVGLCSPDDSPTVALAACYFSTFAGLDVVGYMPVPYLTSTMRGMTVRDTVLLLDKDPKTIGIATE